MSSMVFLLANYNVRMPCREVPSAIGSPRLDDNRTALGRGYGIEWPLASAALPAKRYRTNLWSGRQRPSRQAVQGLRLWPNCPMKPSAQLHVFVGNVVAFIVQW